MNCNDLSSRVSLLENYQSRGTLYSFKFVEELPTTIDIRYKTSVYVVGTKAYFYVGNDHGDTGIYRQWKYLGSIANETDLDTLAAKVDSLNKEVEDIKKTLKNPSIIMQTGDLISDARTINENHTEGGTCISNSLKEKKEISISFFNENREEINIPYTLNEYEDSTNIYISWKTPIPIEKGDIYYVAIMKIL